MPISSQNSIQGETWIHSLVSWHWINVHDSWATAGLVRQRAAFRAC